MKVMSVISDFEAINDAVAIAGHDVDSVASVGRADDLLNVHCLDVAREQFLLLHWFCALDSQKFLKSLHIKLSQIAL